MSIRGTRLPISRNALGSVKIGLAAAIVVLKVLPAIKSEYLMLLPAPETTPFVTESAEAGTPNCAAASPTRTVRAAAAAPRMLVGRIAVLVEELAAANACSETFVSS